MVPWDQSRSGLVLGLFLVLWTGLLSSRASSWRPLAQMALDTSSGMVRLWGYMAVHHEVGGHDWSMHSQSWMASASSSWQLVALFMCQAGRAAMCTHGVVLYRMWWLGALELCAQVAKFIDTRLPQRYESCLTLLSCLYRSSWLGLCL